MAHIDVPYLRVKQFDSELYLVSLAAKHVVTVAYTAVRGVSEEPGAVQRLLNPRRVTSVKEFTIAVGHYPGTIVLNWMNNEHPLGRHEGKLRVPLVQHSAQIIDGQHRMAGIKAAMAEKAEIGDIALAIAMYDHLSTQQCADIFLSINTEQKTVPRSLVYDLYGVASDAMVDPAAERARDIAIFLHESEESPYRNLVKLPGSPRRKVGIALSTIVSALKPLVEFRGPLEQIGVSELEMQKRVILNFLNVLRKKLGVFWDDRENVFQYAAGFAGAMEFFRSHLIPFCNATRSFELATMDEVIALSPSDAILQSSVRGLSGGQATATVAQELVARFKSNIADTATLRI